LDVFAEVAEIENLAVAAGASASSSAENSALSKAATNAARRRLAAQSSLFDLANQKVVDELREADLEEMGADDARDLLRKLKDRII
jgi:hypothetical protein